MPSRREIENQLERLESNRHVGERPLRQTIRYDLAEQWEGVSGHDMSHIQQLGDQHA